MSHQVGASGVHQSDTDSNLVLVLCLRPLRKCPKLHQGQLPHARFPGTFVVGWDLRELSSEVNRIH